jgi:SET domain-containing protein
MSDITINSLSIFFSKLLSESKDYYENELKKEQLLKLKLGLNLNKVHVKESNIHGNGLFAKTNIKQGEIITIYPCDILAYYPEKNREDKEHVVAYIFCDELQDNQDAKNLFHDNKKFYKDYQLVINESYSAIGLPEITNNPSYLGHLCNDGARGHSLSDKKIYETVSVLKSNAYFKNICDCMMVVVAIKDINENDEILVTYGHGYWISRT